MSKNVELFRQLISSQTVDAVAVAKHLKQNGMTVRATKKRCYDVRYLDLDYEQIHYEVEKIKQAERKARLKAMGDLGVKVSRKKKGNTFILPANTIKVVCFFNDGTFKETQTA